MVVAPGSVECKLATWLTAKPTSKGFCGREFVASHTPGAMTAYLVCRRTAGSKVNVVKEKFGIYSVP